MENTTSSLEAIMDYTNPHVIFKFTEEYDISKEEAIDIFNETKIWLWLSDQCEELFIDDCMAIIDKMWHTFILFTQDYHDFCNTHFGYYIHHAPNTQEDKKRFREDKSNGLVAYKKSLKAQCKFIYELLGPELGEKTLTKWFNTYSNKYPRRLIKKLRK